MRTVRVAMVGLAALTALTAGRISCGGEGSEGFEEGTATVTNPPPRPVGAQQNELFNPTFVGWQFGGSFACDPNGQPVTIQIWDGVADPCTETPPEGARVVVLEASGVGGGSFLVGQACTVPRSAGAMFGIVQGGTLFVQRATQGSMAVLALDANDVLSGTFSVQFPTTFGPTVGGFNADPTCLQLPPIVPIGGGTTPPGGTPPPVGGGTNTGVGTGTGTGVGSGTGNGTGTRGTGTGSSGF